MTDCWTCSTTTIGLAGPRDQLGKAYSGAIWRAVSRKGAQIAPPTTRRCVRCLFTAPVDSIDLSAVHNAVLALATVYCPDPRLADGSASRAFAATAKSYIEMEVERPMLSTVQGACRVSPELRRVYSALTAHSSHPTGLMVLGSVHSGVGRHGAGYYYAGGGLRLSTTLGLGLDTSPYLGKGLIDQETKEERERGFWLTFIQGELRCCLSRASTSLSRASALLELIADLELSHKDKLWSSCELRFRHSLLR